MLYYITDPYNNMMTASLNGAKVINCSFKSAGCSYLQYEQDIINMVVANGSVIVAAAGNGNTFGSCGPEGMGYYYPASYDNVISVAGTYQDSYFYNNTHYTFNDKVDLTAPAFNVMSTSLNNSYSSPSGTSFAAPLTSGTIGLMLAVKNCLTPYEIEYILKKTADNSVNNTQLHPENAPFVNISGAGRIDAYAALQLTQTWPQNLVNYVNITGPQLVCTSGTFNLNNLPNGVGIQWVPNQNVSISSGQGTPSVTVSKTSNGPGSLYAIITSNCNETVSLPPINFHVGTYSSGNYPITGPNSVCKNQYVYVNTNELPGATNYNWLWPSSWTYANGQGTRYLALRTTNLSTTGAVSVRVDNTCGPGGSYENKVIVVNPCGGSFAVYPNPTSDGLIIESILIDTPSETTPSDNKVFLIQLKNFNGELKKSASTDNGRIQINTADLPEGSYFLIIKNSSQSLSEQIIIKR